MKCPNCDNEMVRQQALIDKFHLEQMYCHNCGRSLKILDDEEADYECGESYCRILDEEEVKHEW